MKSMTYALLAVALMGSVNACSTTGGMYKEGDAVNGDFSVWRTIALPFAVAGVVVGAAVVGAASAYSEPEPDVIIVCRYRC
jgi:hypothetical protein